MQKFENENYRIRKLKEWGLPFTKEYLKYSKSKTGKICRCEILGYIDDNEIVVKLENSLIVNIMPEYLAEMQTGKFENILE